MWRGEVGGAARRPRARRLRASQDGRAARGEPTMGEAEAGALAAGEVVYDHLARRLARVVRVGEAGVDLVDERAGLAWTADGLYRLGLERLERPHGLVLAYEVPALSARRARFAALPPLEQALAACRALRTGPARRPAWLPAALSAPVKRDELARELQATSGRPARDVDDALDALHAAGGRDERLRVDADGVRVRLPGVSWLVERVVERPRRAERDDGGEPGLVAPGAEHTAEEEAALLWALREVVRLEATPARDLVATHRLDVLRPRLWATFRPGVAARLARFADPERPWADPEAAPDEVFDLLLALLVAPTPDRPPTVAALADLLAAPGGVDLARPPSQELHRALYGCCDALRRDRARPALRLGSFDPEVDDGPGAARPVDSARAAAGPRELGFRELRQLVFDQAPHEGRAAREARARALLQAIRAAFLRGLGPLEGPQYRAVLLDFLTLLDRPRIAEVTGVNYNTLRGWFPRSGTGSTRPPVFVRGLVPEALRGFVGCLGRVFPVLRAGLLPREEEIDALVDDEAARVVLGALFVHEDLDGRGDFWREGALATAARELGQTELELVERTLLPFLERLVEHRRAHDLARGDAAARTAAARTTAEDLELAALALLLLGAPDGGGLGRLLAGRDVAARRRLAAEAGLGVMDLVDLELGRRWATPAELEGLGRALGPEADDALAGLRPALGAGEGA